MLLTVAAFIERALYDPERGYYATRAQRSGREGDFVTSVDAGPLFGTTLAVQLIEMLERTGPDGAGRFDLVEAGAGNGRLMHDVLGAIARQAPALHRRLRVTLVERSGPARDEASRLLAGGGNDITVAGHLPARIHGVLFANELLDAFPVHVLELTADGWREVYLQPLDDGRIEQVQGALSDTRLLALIPDSPCEIGTRIERSLAVPDWFDAASIALQRGFVLLLDYVSHQPGDTLAAYRQHRFTSRWFDEPGTRDITSHVDLPGARAAAAGAGFDEIGVVDQTYFLTALGILDQLSDTADAASIAARMTAKMLILPGGLGSTIKVMGFAKHVDGHGLRGFSAGRLT